MLKPLSPSSESDAYFVVTDIENEPDGTVIDIGTSYRDDDTGEIVHILHESWADYWRWIRRMGKKDKRFRKVYGHNGGGWDWLSLIEYLLHDGRDERISLTAVTAGSSMVVLSVKIAKKFTVQFCDSLQLLRSKLDDLSEQLLGKNKVDLGGKLPHEIKAENPKLYYEYLETDCENLLCVLEVALDVIREHVAEIPDFGATIGATAMKVFRTVGMDEPITIPWEPELREFLRGGYRGGRVECFRTGRFSGVSVYDINSLYPTAMVRCQVPISGRVEMVSRFTAERCGVYRLKYKQYNRGIPPVLMSGGKGEYEGEGIYFSPEIEKLLLVDKNAIIDVDEGYEFLDTARVFQRFVSRLYQLRLDNPDTPLSLLCKYLMNSLYGKWGQNPIREKIIVCESIDELVSLIDENGAIVRPINDDLGIMSLEQETTVNFEHVGIAGTITSYARSVLYDGLLAAGDRLIYCDTDSVHLDGPFDRRLVGAKLGEYKKEFEGEGVYCGKKLYALRDSKGREKVRAKGVSVGGRNGAGLGFDDLYRVSQGEAIRAEFSRPPTPKEVFAGKTACKFTPRHRTVKATA